MYHVGIDVGGTFSDFVVLDESENVMVFKVPSTPNRPTKAVITGLSSVEFSLSEIEFLVHGTTVATNAVIQRKGAKVALITTVGFKDVIEIGRQDRPFLYALHVKRPEVLVAPQDRYEISERVNNKGEVEKKLQEKELQELAKRLASSNYESVAVCFLFSFYYPKHEQRVKQVLEEHGLLVSISSEVLPEFREYERMSTTVMDAYVKPIMRSYMLDLEESLKGLGVSCNIGIMQSNGGITSPKRASERPVTTLLSGLAGGVLAGLYTSRLTGIQDVITLDIGGTSTDVGLLQGRFPKVTRFGSVSGIPVSVPVVDVITIGAGGGSIAQVIDGFFKVGPESAGADPGPLCYNRGGTKVTTTDADVYTGRINPKRFAGGTFPLHPELSEKGLKELATQLELSVEETAEGIQKVYRSNIEAALRNVSLERGHDPREFALIPFGGQGPVHGFELAQALEIHQVIIPPFPGVWSAIGLLAADYRHDIRKSILEQLDNMEQAQLLNEFYLLREKGTTLLEKDGFKPENMVFKEFLELRYRGQGYELSVPYSKNMTKIQIQELFHLKHQEAYGFHMPEKPVEIVNLHVIALGKRKLPQLPKPQERIKGTQLQPVGTREVFLNNDWHELKVYQRENLRLNDELQGPCIIDQADTTIFIPEGWNVQLLSHNHLIGTRD